jgi:uncharacterized protein (DUF885 family)
MRFVSLAVVASVALSTVVHAQPISSPQDHARLFALFTASDEAELKRNPIEALSRGDLRYADQLGDPFSDAHFAAERAAAASDLVALRAIDRSKLDPTDQLAYDSFEWQTRESLRLLTDKPLLLSFEVRPIDHFSGIHLWYPDIASGKGAAPFKTVADYENNLKRNAQYAGLLDECIARFRQGMRDKIVQPRLTIRNVIDQLNAQIGQGIENSTFYGPVRQFPAGISAADQKRLRAAYATQI